jgi:PST family polysaccharide transporter
VTRLVPYSFELPGDRLRGRATAGVMKIGLSQVVRVTVQFGSVVMLSRLLSPSDFGLLAMMWPVIGFVGLFQELGLTQAVVQRAQVTQAEVSALFCVSLGVSIGLAALLVVTSPLVTWFYGESRVGPLTAAMSVNVILSGAGSLHYALLSRRMQFGAMAAIDACAAVGGLMASVTSALLYHSFWALYAGVVVAALISTVGLWIATGWWPSLPRLSPGVGAALRYGGNVTGFNVANFFARNLDNVLIGRAWGERPLGLYDRAYRLMMLPLLQVNAPIARVMLPVLSRMASEPQRYGPVFLRMMAQMLLVTLPGIAFMVGTGDVLIPILLGRQWADATPIFVALGMAGFLQALNNPTGWLLMSQNRTRDYMHWGVFSSITCAVSFFIGLPYGPFGVAVAYAVGEYLRTPILWWYTTRRGPVSFGNVIRMALPHFSGAVASVAAILGMRALVSMEPFLVLGTSLILSFLVSGAVLALFSGGRATIMQSVALIRSLVPPAALS